MDTLLIIGIMFACACFIGMMLTIDYVNTKKIDLVGLVVVAATLSIIPIMNIALTSICAKESPFEIRSNIKQLKRLLFFCLPFLPLAALCLLFLL